MKRAMDAAGPAAPLGRANHARPPVLGNRCAIPTSAHSPVPFYEGIRRTIAALATDSRSGDTDDPYRDGAAFETFPSGRIWTFGDMIVTPLVNRRESITASSIDVRLGNQFLIFRRESFPLLDVGNPEGLTARMGRFQERLVLPLREKFVLHPGQLVIGSTWEYVQIPEGLMCYVVGKSGWGRMGLIIATATKVDPGFQGCITLEIINEGEVPLILYPGLPVAQLVLHPAVGKARYSGGYECPIGPEFPKLTPADPRWGFWTSTKKPGQSS